MQLFFTARKQYLKKIFSALNLQFELKQKETMVRELIRIQFLTLMNLKLSTCIAGINYESIYIFVGYFRDKQFQLDK